MNQSINKIFIIGLPRTGTTSVCVALLEAMPKAGQAQLKVAHMAFTKASFEAADAIADAPVFSDYKKLDKLYPNSKFVYLERTIDSWIPSMQRLLERMLPKLDPRAKGGFHPQLRRSFNEVFELAKAQAGQVDILSAPHLEQCFTRHRQQVEAYFTGRDDLLWLNPGDAGALAALHRFLGLADVAEDAPFPHLNQAGRVAGFDEFKHPNKIAAELSGPERRAFFDYGKQG
ncbi:sulfotransferase family protein [Shewanella zhangzhouensis]|uniref:sulfotransferase family protein n=1 Tax=Shewanella zhangzhouensis TaxID=2864213 RepID=UPI001C65A01A|nr:sulfotransferase family protein [Shewanella zhangzhouensis]QYK05548.1 sulfotransferase family protein [Shewanella zhangzhouensis]